MSAEVSQLVGRDVLSIRQFSRELVEHVFRNAAKAEAIVVTGGGGCDDLKHKVLANVFFEPSTRTSGSFEAAMYRLGGKVLKVDAVSSSVKKGETLEDTVRCLECYCDAIVLRHPEVGAAARAAAATTVPVLNAGDGVGEHPTQALLDAFTVNRDLGRVDGITVAMVGDLKHGRTVHSLARLLALFDVRMIFVAPAALAMPSELCDELRTAGISITITESLDEALPEADVLYVTRVQQERFASSEEYARYKDAYIITPSVMARAKGTALLMHPLPRVNEIAVEVDADPRAAYFRQMRYGMFVRMALLRIALVGAWCE